eukprot:Selendium_serpulae@DN5365_c0_g1_i1.p2
MSEDDLRRLYPQALEMKTDLDALLEKFVNHHDQSIPLQQRLGALTAQFSQQTNKMAELLDECSRSMQPQQRSVWEGRVRRLCGEATHCRSSFDRQLGHFHKTQVEAAQREELLKGGLKRDDAHALQREGHALLESREILDNTLSQGIATVKNVSNQNKILKKVRKRLLNIATGVGMSSSLVNIVDRRTTVDRWLVYCLIAFSSLLFVFLYYFVKFSGASKAAIAQVVSPLPPGM